MHTKAKDAFLSVPTSFGESIHYEVLSFVYLMVKKSKLGPRRGSYTFVLLVLLLVSLIIAKFIGVSKHYFVAVLLSAFKYTTFECLVCILYST